jgi:hypothetical protein
MIAEGHSNDARTFEPHCSVAHRNELDLLEHGSLGKQPQRSHENGVGIKRPRNSVTTDRCLLTMQLLRVA